MNDISIINSPLLIFTIIITARQSHTVTNTSTSCPLPHVPSINSRTLLVAARRPFPLT